MHPLLNKWVYLPLGILGTLVSGVLWLAVVLRVELPSPVDKAQLFLTFLFSLLTTFDAAVWNRFGQRKSVKSLLNWIDIIGVFASIFCIVLGFLLAFTHESRPNLILLLSFGALYYGCCDLYWTLLPRFDNKLLHDLALKCGFETEKRETVLLYKMQYLVSLIVAVLMLVVAASVDDYKSARDTIVYALCAMLGIGIYSALKDGLATKGLRRKIFLSHSSANRVLAEAVETHLNSVGFRVWLSHTKAGDELEREIAVQINICDKFLLLLTEQSLCSPWVVKETREALGIQVRGKDIFCPWTTLTMEQLTNGSQSFIEAPELLRRVCAHAVGFLPASPDEPEFQGAIQRLESALRKLDGDKN